MTKNYHLQRLRVYNKRGQDTFPPPALPRTFPASDLVATTPSAESSSEAPFVLVGAEAWLAEGCGGGLGSEGLGLEWA